MRALILISLFSFLGVAHAQKPRPTPNLRRIPLPLCDRHLANILDDPVTRAPYDEGNLNGVIAIDAQLTVESFQRAVSGGAFLMGTGPKGAYFTQPPKRGLLRVPNFLERLSPRGQRLIHSRKEAGYTVTFDQAFESVLLGCARARGGVPSWINHDVYKLFMQLHVHPDAIAHSVEVWVQGRLVGGLIVSFVQGVPMGESMFFERGAGNHIGWVALAALLERLEKKGHPWLDVQVITPQESLAYWFRAELLDRYEHLEELAKHQALRLDF